MYSPGEPSGIGVDLVIKLCSLNFWGNLKLPIVCIADSKLILDRAKVLGIKINIDELKDINNAKRNKKNTLQIFFVSVCKDTQPGKLKKINASYVIENLDFAINYSKNNKRTALVTGPISKENVIHKYKNFTGHTERIKEKTDSKSVLMMLASSKLKVALATTHIPLKDVPKKITKKLLITKIQILHEELKNKFNIKNPKIKMLGLNPHSGENGKIGKEEKSILIPTAKYLRGKNINVSLPISADTAFTKKNLMSTDAYFGMYHDQVLPVLKALSFGKSFNITLGTSIIRTSVDHGVALDIAGSKKSDESSLKEAIKIAAKLIK